MSAYAILDILENLKAGEKVCAVCGKVKAESEMDKDSLEEGNRFGVCKSCIPKGWKKV